MKQRPGRLDEADVGDLISEAAELFRGVPFSKVTADLLRSSKGTSADYALSQPCKLNSVDFFVSHSAWTMPTSVTGFDERVWIEHSAGFAKL